MVRAVLKQVMYVPELGSNLFSVKAAAKEGMSVMFKEHEATISDSRGRVVGTGRIQGNLYYLNATLAHSARVAAVKEEGVDLWHRRLGHVSHKTLQEMAKNGTVTGMKLSAEEEPKFCEACIEGKMTRTHGKPVGEIRTTRRLELVHSDVWGPCTPVSFGGSRYFVSFTDDFSRCTNLYFMKTKGEVLEKFKEFEAHAVGDSGDRIGRLRTDNGGEYMSKEMLGYLRSRQIAHETTAPYTPDQNGVAEPNPDREGTFDDLGVWT